jgi:chemotaxis response regulator CheB
MATQLRKAKCIVHVANHGADALLFLKQTTFARDCGPKATPLSIVLMDLEMPVMDGLTAVIKIREMQNSKELTRPVPVIAVSSGRTRFFIGTCTKSSTGHCKCKTRTSQTSKGCWDGMSIYIGRSFLIVKVHKT